jgi:hypothetical protein
MKTFIYSIVCAALCSTSFGGECVGSCRKPVRNALVATSNVVERAVAAPVRVVKNVATNVQQRRVCRRCR